MLPQVAERLGLDFMAITGAAIPRLGRDDEAARARAHAVELAPRRAP